MRTLNEWDNHYLFHCLRTAKFWMKDKGFRQQAGSGTLQHYSPVHSGCCGNANYIFSEPWKSACKSKASALSIQGLPRPKLILIAILYRIQCCYYTVLLYCFDLRQPTHLFSNLGTVKVPSQSHYEVLLYIDGST